MTKSHKKTNNILNISQLKSNIQRILTNIKELEALQHNNGVSESNVDSLVQQTDKLINLVETSPLEGFANEIKKRKERRKLKKSRMKEIKRHLIRNKKLQILTSTSSTALLKGYEESVRSFTDSVSSTNCSNEAITEKPHICLLKGHEAQCFRCNLELPQMPGQNVDDTEEFTEKPSNLRTTCRKKLENIAPETSKKKHTEEQWNEVFFGPVEHSYNSGKQKIGDLLRIRRIWDSYLVRGTQGTHIPCGWVVPREDALTDWQQYKAT